LKPVSLNIHRAYNSGCDPPAYSCVFDEWHVSVSS